MELSPSKSPAKCMSEGLVPEFLFVFHFLFGFPLDVPDERGTRRPWLEEGGTPFEPFSTSPLPKRAWPNVQRKVLDLF